MRFRLLLTALIISASGIAARADTAYTLNLVLNDGNAISGSFTVGALDPSLGPTTFDLTNINLVSNEPDFYFPVNGTGGNLFSIPPGFYPYSDPADYIDVFQFYARVYQSPETYRLTLTTVTPTSSPVGPFALNCPLCINSFIIEGGQLYPPFYEPYTQYVSSGTLTLATPPPASVTPEPSSFILLGTGLLGIAGMIRKRLAWTSIPRQSSR